MIAPTKNSQEEGLRKYCQLETINKSMFALNTGENLLNEMAIITKYIVDSLSTQSSEIVTSNLHLSNCV